MYPLTCLYLRIFEGQEEIIAKYKKIAEFCNFLSVDKFWNLLTSNMKMCHMNVKFSKRHFGAQKHKSKNIEKSMNRMKKR